ncbi:hypothetical protein TVAG_444130 [Trichomonas vaginalis G3]|uniref:Uncharacterized protein n=1 Tax=Trichomonas vaginalis (strain ATCC PRA-98 / G3) TaxID=412133 RepID=A2E2F5_TRIV3|nr:hypothetical protein TVAGG3_0305600 [Trichomonas vaginalis G3]EAY13130.1 hypothetical protein TVAG_444130 [Trichomonas vaginalis G3]KAI5528232.1 hypothetical protein TVAGG3_0305600 [Trichomonas vaginalis G3]|eukprot:XP_001325353.1 hypothetical protein [Trichomonas vaginalis G3]
MLEFVFQGKCEYLYKPAQLLAKDMSMLHIPSERIALKEKFRDEHLEELKQKAYEMGVRLANE